MNPHLIIDGIFSYRNLQHMVIIYDFLELRVYINAEQRARSEILKGNFSNWDPTCSLVIGNEVTGDRPWKGKIYYAAVFDKPLTDHEIRQNYLSGLRLKTNKESPKHTGIKAKSPIVRYLFDEGMADVIHDDGLVSNHVNLLIPKYIKRKTEKFLNVSVETEQFSNVSIGSSWIKSQFSDIILNIFIFIPLGGLIHGMLRTRYGKTLKISFATLLAGTLFAISAESLQHFSMTRTSSLIDVFLNMAGIVIGIVIDRSYNLFLNNQADQFQMLLFRNRKSSDQTSIQK